VLKVDEPFGFDVTFDFFDACFKSKDILDEVHGLAETPLEVSRDVFMNEESPSLGFDNNILPNPLDHSHVSPICSLPSISPEYSLDAPFDSPKLCDSNVELGYAGKMFNMIDGNVDNFMSLGYFTGYNASLDPYYMYLVDKPRKIMWNTFFYFSFDFPLYLV